VIVDYKTDDISDDALKQRFQSYQEQGLWHYRAVREAARERVKDLLFFSRVPGRSDRSNQTNFDSQLSKCRA
jgi:ATP-dependent exoDNAse (exonuclease V) beta subunit